MKSGCLLALLFILAISCTSENESGHDHAVTLFPEAKTYPLNTDDGYTLNTVSGDTIRPVVNSLGDTIKTGVSISAEGRVIDTDSIFEPTVVSVGLNPTIVSAHANMHPVPRELTVIAVDESKLMRHNSSNTNSMSANGAYMLNSSGDTVKTGVPVQLTGKMVPRVFTKSSPALPMRMKDNAICDIQYLDVDQGMSSSYILSALEDQSGNLWFGTNGAGVSRYDGQSFVSFTVEEGLSNNYVRAIFEDKSGNIWFGTNGGGVTKYDGESFVHFTENEGLASNVVWSILEDQAGNLWFGTDGGVLKYDGKWFTHYTVNEGLSNNSVRTVFEDQSGNLWFGTFDGGASKFDGDSFIHFTKAEGLSSDIVWSILEDQSGNMWFGTNGGGATKYDGESLTHYTEAAGLSNNIVWCMHEDQSGNIWLGTYGGGVSKFDGQSFSHYTETEGLSNSIIWCILEDRSENLWFGTNGGGVSKYDRKSFIHYTENEGLSNNIAWSILEDRSGNTWFGTNGTGVSKYDGKSYTHYTVAEGLPDNFVLSMLEDQSGNIWLGTYSGGVSKLEGETLVNYSEGAGLSNNIVLCMEEDHSGNIWFGTEGGVSKFDGETFVHFTEQDGLSNNSVRAIYEDDSGNLWFGTNGGGVTKYDGKSFIHYTEKEGLSSNYVWSVIEDHSGNIWFGGAGGVSKFDGKSFVHFTEVEGLSNNFAWSVYEDNSGNIWVGTEKGLSVLQLQDSLSADSHYMIHSFNKGDGLKGLDFYSNSVMLDSKNQIWLGSGKGLEVLNLDEFKPSEKTPLVFLKSLDINETFVDYRNLADSAKTEIVFSDVEAFENYPLDLELPYDKSHLTFHFAAIDWAAPHKIKYQYKLEGLNDNWSLPTNETKADYRNIPYGSYTFKARAIGESQVWSEPFAYTFTIHPPWWHTWWYRALVALFMVVFLFLAHRRRTAALRAGQKQLEKTVEERTAELVQKNIIVEEQKQLVEKQKGLVEEKHKEITDSINYAERIQRSFLATKNLLDGNLKNYFVFFQPKDVVSGDFYWATKLSNGNFALVTADSTGHGVPGAIMSILNITCLEKAVEEARLVDPGEILNHARLNVIERLKKDGSAEGGKDGMDASLVCFDLKNKKLSYAAANNPVWIVRQNEMLEFGPDKMPVGKHDKQHIPFTSHQLELQTGDVVYTLTDGYPDQFGGEKGKKFMDKRLKELLISIAADPMEIQQQKLSDTFKKWKGGLEQVDDVCIIGVRI